MKIHYMDRGISLCGLYFPLPNGHTWIGRGHASDAPADQRCEKCHEEYLKPNAQGTPRKELVQIKTVLVTLASGKQIEVNMITQCLMHSNLSLAEIDETNGLLSNFQQRHRL